MQNNNKTSRVNLLFPFFKFRAESICCSVERTLLVTFMSSNLSVDRVYHPGLDRHGAVDVSGDLDVPRGLPRAQGGRRNPDVEFNSALRRLVLHEPSVGDP
jgi:hypothetical protein